MCLVYHRFWAATGVKWDRYEGGLDLRAGWRIQSVERDPGSETKGSGQS